MQRHLRSHWKTWLVLAIGLLALTVLCGCPFSPKDDDDPCPNPPCGPDDESPSRKTPKDLLESYFEDAYNQRDSIAYAEMLHDEFQFEFLLIDADSLRDVLGSDNFWGRTLDLRSTGVLFRSPDVTGITLNLQVISNNLHLGEDCVGCRDLLATVTLRVTTVGEEEDLTYTVDSPQIFVCKQNTSPPDTLWTIFRQIDQPRS